MPFSYYERLTLFATLFISVTLIAFTGEVSAFFWAGSMINLVLVAYVQASGRKPLLATATVPTLLAITFAAADFLYIAPNFLVAIVDLVLLLMSIKALSANRVADNLQMIGLSFLLVLAAAVITADAMFGLLFLLYIFAGLAALVLQNLRGHWESAGGETEVLGRRRGVLGRAFALAVAALCVGVLLFTLVLYFAFPRVGFRMWRAEVNLSSRVSGFSESVRLNDVGRIQTNPAIALQVEFLNGEVPPEDSNLRRLRGVVLDRFDGLVWHDTRNAVKPANRSGRFEWLFSDEKREQTLRISPDSSYSSIVFAPKGLVALRGPFTSVGTSIEGDLVAERGNWGRVSYELDLGTVAPDTNSPLPEHFEVPDNVTPRMRGLVEKWGEGLTGRELADRLTLRLATELAYSTALADDSVASPLDRFLFETKAGHCEMFAASLAIMLRTEGIPTRLVNGFQGGEAWDEKSIVFRDLHAHSWVEAYFEDSGWVEFDPTPPSTELFSWQQEAMRRYYDTLARARLFWGRWFIDYDFGTQQAIAKDFRQASDRIGARLGKLRELSALRDLITGNRGVFWGAGIALVVGLLVWGKRPRPRGKVSSNRLSRLYRKRLKAAERARSRTKGETPLQFAVALAHADRRWEGFGNYTELYYKLRYGNGTADDAVRFLELHESLPKRG